MNRTMFAGILLLTCGAGLAALQTPGSTRPNARAVAHGKYLVTRVATCSDCHTPTGPRGEPDRAHWLQGAPLAFQPEGPVPGWTSVAPGIAGLPAGWSYADTVHFLETGKKPDGRMANPPMPRVRLSHGDAVAVASYLSTLPSGRK